MGKVHRRTHGDGGEDNKSTISIADFSPRNTRGLYSSHQLQNSLAEASVNCPVKELVPSDGD